MCGSWESQRLHSHSAPTSPPPTIMQHHMRQEARQHCSSTNEVCASVFGPAQTKAGQLHDSVHLTLGEPFFDMFCLKVAPCMRSDPHDWCSCAFTHPGEKAARRDPRIYSYTGIACIDMKKEGRCALGDRCPYAHSAWEYWLHPSRYHTQICKQGGACSRRACFFAHKQQELIKPLIRPQVHPETAELCNRIAVALSAPSLTSPGPQLVHFSQAHTPQSPPIIEGMLNPGLNPSVPLPPRHAVHASPFTARAASTDSSAVLQAPSLLAPATPAMHGGSLQVGSGTASLYCKHEHELYRSLPAGSRPLGREKVVHSGLDQLCSALTAQTSLAPSRAPSADDLLSALLMMAGGTPHQTPLAPPQGLLLQEQHVGQHGLGEEGGGKVNPTGGVAGSSFLAASLMASSGWRPSYAAPGYPAPAATHNPGGVVLGGQQGSINLLPPNGCMSSGSELWPVGKPSTPPPIPAPTASAHHPSLTRPSLQSNWDHLFN